MRDYDPTTGRYIQADPLGLVDGASVYGYAKGNPLYWTDPTGECVGPAAIACGAVGGAVLGVALGALLDYLEDGCFDYTLEEAAWDAAWGAAFGGAGSALGRAYSAYKGAAGARAAATGAGAASALTKANPVGSALKDDIFHRGATWTREYAARNGTHFPIVGGDGATRTLTQVPGSLNGNAGRFEYIVDSAGNLVHQLFVKGGRINGVPIVP